MVKKGHRKATQPLDSITDRLGWQSLLNAHIAALEVKNFSATTISQRTKYVRWFALWAIERGATKPGEVTKAIVERYQRHLYNYRDPKGKPMSFPSQHKHLSHLKSYFSWLAKHNHILFNPASELELPKLGHRLPKAILSASEADKVIEQPDVNEACGLRDRAMLELLYSCGIRRRELAELKLYSFDRDRKTLMITQGKGKKDRVVPIGQRALDWIERYLEEGRPELVIDPNEQTLFLSTLGQPLEPDSLTEYVREYVIKADIGKKGSCHMFRHTMATLMLENGADIRYIQAMLGHADLRTTQIYTQVSIRKLQQIHRLTHPASQAGDERPEAGGKTESNPED
ncbi:MAG: site-specific tyrosine recombinase XerC [Pirellula sp.]